MKKRLSKQDKAILDNLDRMLAGQPTIEASGFVEEKILQVLRKFEYLEEKRALEQQSISSLMSDISHQIKTPLAGLIVHLELADDEALNGQERAAALAECKNQAGKIAFLSEAMFKAARLEAGLICVRTTSEDAVATVRSALCAMHPAAVQKGLAVTLNAPERLVVPHDPVWTKEALLNILDNAIKYTEAGAIAITLEKGAVYTRIDVADTGAGVLPGDYAKIFARFYRARQPGTQRVEGTGLGLSIAREIMRQQGGNITVSSNGKGSVFSLFLQNR